VAPAAYAPTQTEAPQAAAPAMSSIEQQLALQHREQAQLLPILRQESKLLLDNHITLLDGLARTTTVTPDNAGGVVLGFEVATGSVASKDFAVGKVCQLQQKLCQISVCDHIF